MCYLWLSLKTKNRRIMELKTAIEILEYHQEWRLGKRDDMIHEPKKLTEALDIVLLKVASVPELLEALKKITEMNYQTAQAKYGDKNKAKEWACVVLAEKAIELYNRTNHS